MIKKIGIGVLVLLVIIGAGVYFLYSNLDSLIKSAIQTYGSAATQAEVRLDKVNLSISSGEGGLVGLRVGNPKGFATPLAIAFGLVNLKLDTSTVTGSGPIVIHELSIDKPQVTYERNDSGGNLETIQKNTMDYAGGSSGGSSGGGKSAPTPASSSGGDSGRKIIIENLYVRDGQIGISHALLQGKSLSTPLPTIHLTNIGKDKGGATPAEITQQVLGAITSAASKAASIDLEKTLGSLKDNVGGKVKDAVPGVGNSVKGLLGK